jgi:hypothetical protein
MAAPNLIQITSVYGRTTSTSIGTAVTTLVSNPTSSNKSYKINSLFIANVDTAGPVQVSVDFFRSGASIRLLDRMSISPGDTLVGIARDTAIYLEEGDSLRAYADVAGRTHIIMTYEINA